MRKQSPGKLARCKQATTCQARGLLALVILSVFAREARSQQRMVYHIPEGPVQPLQWDQLPSWMSLDMELRGRTEEQTSLGYVSGKDRLYELTRARGGLTVRPLSFLDGFVQFQDTHALGLPLRDVNPTMRNDFDFFQAYLRLHYRPAQIFAGRQELRFGDERVVGISDWTNNGRTFDGFDLRLGDKNRADIFSSSVVVVHPESLDKHGAGLTFHGVEGNVNSLIDGTSLQPFVLVKAEPRVVSQQKIAGTETEVTFGLAFDSKIPGNFDASGTGDLQRGSYSNDSIHAGAAILRGGYTLPSAPWKPRLQAEYDYATGNPHRNPLRIGTYDQQYPSNHNVFGLVDLFGFQNIKQDRLSLSVTPKRDLSLLLQTGSLHVVTTKDGVYNGVAGVIFAAPAGGLRGAGIGTEFDASASYVARKYFVTRIGVGHFFPGEAMTTNRHGAPLTLAYLQFSYRFTVNKANQPDAH